jgi:hypothetical protein
LVRDGGALRNRIVSAQHQSRAILSGAGQVGVAKYIAAPIDTRPFSVPDPDHAFHLALADHFINLAAHDGRRRQVLIHGGPKVDVVLR